MAPPATGGLTSKPHFEALLRGLGDLVLQVAGFMIAAELAQRRFVELKQDIAQLRGVRIAGCEAAAVNLAQRAEEGVAVLVADVAVVVAMTMVQTWLAHAALHGGRERQHPPAGVRWQLRQGCLLARRCSAASAMQRNPSARRAALMGFAALNPCY